MLDDNQNGKSITWEEPTADDFQKEPLYMTSSHKPGDIFTEGVTKVTYKFEDKSGNEQFCLFQVIVSSKLKLFNLPLNKVLKKLNLYIYNSAETT